MDPLFCPLCGAQARVLQVVEGKVQLRCSLDCPTTFIERADESVPFEPEPEKVAVIFDYKTSSKEP